MPGGKNNNTHIVQGLRLEATSSPNDPLVQIFFAEYDKAFILESEKEPLSGFLDCLALNEAPQYQILADEHGPFQELVVVATEADATDPALVAGANFIAFAHHNPLPGQSELIITINLNYLFIPPQFRGRGYLHKILKACAPLARAVLQTAMTTRASGASQSMQPTDVGARLEAAPVLIFLEQNDPLRMDPADYALDSQHAGLDQIDRIAIWAKLGARIIDFPYVQPALSADQKANDSLLFSVIGASSDTLDCAILRNHLARFFAISVLKGASVSANKTALRQLDALTALAQSGKPIRLLDPTRWINLQNKHNDTKHAPENPSLRDVLRQFD